MSGQCLSADVPGQPLSPGTRRRLGGPLPRQLANQTRAPPQAPGLAVPGFDFQVFEPGMSCGISVPFGTLSPTRRQVTHVLLTRLPLYSGIAPLSRSTCMC